MVIGISDLFSRVSRISDRHRRNTFISLFYECFIRGYRHSKLLRICVKPFFGDRSPSQWLFVTGCYNAGTTVVKNFIALHPDVSCLPIEGDLLTDEFSNYENGGWKRGMLGNRLEIESDRMNATIDVEKLRADWSPWIVDKKQLLDKSISHITRISTLSKIFPESKFILVTRQPEQVVAGILKRSKPIGAAKLALKSDKYDRDYLLAQWCYLYRLAIEDLPDDRCLIISYEDAMTNPLEVCRRMHRYFNLTPVNLSVNKNTLEIADSSLALRNQSGKPASVVNSGLSDRNMLLHSIECLEKNENVRLYLDDHYLKSLL